MSDLDPAAVMAAHPSADHWCADHWRVISRAGWPCEPYRLAEALAASETRLAHVEECWRETNAECIKHWNRADVAEAKLARVAAVEKETLYGTEWMRAYDVSAALADQPEHVSP
jgi:hypothetical protein